MMEEEDVGDRIWGRKEKDGEETEREIEKKEKKSIENRRVSLEKHEDPIKHACSTVFATPSI
jgi:hypothetical protein